MNPENEAAMVRALETIAQEVAGVREVLYHIWHERSDQRPELIKGKGKGKADG